MKPGTRQVLRQDPRIARTLKTLGEALMALIVERGYDVLTVQDITDRANVSRTTFYLHFKDKDELLFETMKHIYDELTGHIKHQINDIRDIDDLASVTCDAPDFEHVAENADFYRMIFGKHGSAAFVQVVLNYLAKEVQKTLALDLSEQKDDLPVPLEFMAAYFAGAEIGIMNWWLQNDLRYPPEKMAQMQYWLSVGGILAVLNMMKPKESPAVLT